MTAQRKYPEELGEHAVKMVLEVRERKGRETGRSPGLPGSEIAGTRGR